MAMRIFLDDIKNPSDVYPPDGTAWVTVRTVSDCIAIINRCFTDNRPIEVVSLDNDLGVDSETGESLPEGYLVAKFLEDLAFNGKDLSELDIRVHSSNVVRNPDIRIAISNIARYSAKT